MDELICMYDNPENGFREYWVNGKRIGWYTKEFLDQEPQTVKVSKKAEIHLAPFNSGRITGNKGAIKISNNEKARS